MIRMFMRQKNGIYILRRTLPPGQFLYHTAIADAGVDEDLGPAAADKSCITPAAAGKDTDRTSTAALIRPPLIFRNVREYGRYIPGYFLPPRSLHGQGIHFKKIFRFVHRLLLRRWLCPHWPRYDPLRPQSFAGPSYNHEYRRTP